jgi:hypothetical protein
LSTTRLHQRAPHPHSRQHRIASPSATSSDHYACLWMLESIRHLTYNFFGTIETILIDKRRAFQTGFAY